jgi:hypothetical protein
MKKQLLHRLLLIAILISNSAERVKAEVKDEAREFLLREARINREKQELRQESIIGYERYIDLIVKREGLQDGEIILKGHDTLVKQARKLVSRVCKNKVTIDFEVKKSENRQDINASISENNALQVTSESLTLPENELLAMLAHELVHAFRQDAKFTSKLVEIDYKQRKKLESRINSGEANWVVSIQVLAAQKVTRKQEVFADLAGAALLELNGYEYDSLEKLFTRLMQMNVREDDALQSLVGEDIKDHPYLNERIEILRQYKPSILKLVEQIKSTNSCFDLSKPNIQFESPDI